MLADDMACNPRNQYPGEYATAGDYPSCSLLQLKCSTMLIRILTFMETMWKLITGVMKYVDFSG